MTADLALALVRVFAHVSVPAPAPVGRRLTGLARGGRWRAGVAALLCAGLGGLLGGCASTAAPVAGPPFSAAPVTRPIYLERVVSGSIYQANLPATSLFSNDRRPRDIGDTLKVDISEKLDVSRQLATDTSRANSVASKGPGSGGGGLLGKILNMDATASGSDTFKGSGKTANSSSFTGQIAVQVINVLPNGHLVIAGERQITVNGSVGTLRLAGVVNPQDIATGNVVASKDLVNARFEVAGEGEVQDASGKSWVQRLLTRQLAVW